jgi:protein scribble
VSKLHRRDTPHHLKNKRVQHLNNKAANMILTKLKEKPVEESQQVEMNPMPELPLVQDVGLPIIEHHIMDVNQNGIEISPNLTGEFFFSINLK